MPVFLFTDIEGSTRLWEEHTAEMGEIITRHDEILRQLIEGHGGQGGRDEPGDRERARELLRQSQAAFEEMGVPRYAAVAAVRLQALEEGGLRGT
jgi:class 3 adenylate cyclase